MRTDNTSSGLSKIMETSSAMSTKLIEKYPAFMLTRAMMRSMENVRMNDLAEDLFHRERPRIDWDQTGRAEYEQVLKQWTGAPITAIAVSNTWDMVFKWKNASKTEIDAEERGCDVIVIELSTSRPVAYRTLDGKFFIARNR